jgi:DNA helicase-2/ATP-dependent DNA helicase PcrA
VDEAQDLDRSQLDLALTLAAPDNRIFLVGDDDQSIYGWRLADVRRVLGLAARLPNLRRVDLEVNYRCPGPVVERAVRLVEVNRERFRKVVRPGPEPAGTLILAPDGADDVMRLRRAIGAWPADDGTRAVLARTNRELLPAVAAAADLGLPFRAPRIASPLDSPFIDELLDEAAGSSSEVPLLVRLGRVARSAAVDAAGPRDRGRPDEREADGSRRDEAGFDVFDRHAPVEGDQAFDRRSVGQALLAWAAPYPDLSSFAAAIRERRLRLAELRRDDAPLTLATAHGTKGLEFDHVIVLADGFPAIRSVTEGAEPERALEEERRLAYVAWTRARRSLTLLYDPVAPSPFLLEAFSPIELGLDVTMAA